MSTCPYCGYEELQIDGMGLCPECGEIVTEADVYEQDAQEKQEEKEE